VAVHANGEAAIDAFLDAVAKAKDRGIALAAPPIVVHAQMARDDQLDRMLELGVEPSFFVLHTYYWGDRHRDRFLGPDRARRISPAKSALERGLRFTLHTDSPVTPMDPWLLLWSAVNRRTTSGEALGPEQRLSPLQALRATTIDAAIQLGVGDDRGSLEAGKLADFIVVDRDPLAVERDALRDIRVLATYVGGTPVVS
jgi:predicted amidohydrolase YtcJ